MTELTRGVKITGEERTELTARVVEMYGRDRMSVRDIAAETGRSYGFIHRLLDEAGVERRPRGGPRTITASESRRINEYRQRLASKPRRR